MKKILDKFGDWLMSDAFVVGFHYHREINEFTNSTTYSHFRISFHKKLPINE